MGYVEMVAGGSVISDGYRTSIRAPATNVSYTMWWLVGTVGGSDSQTVTLRMYHYSHSTTVEGTVFYVPA